MNTLAPLKICLLKYPWCDRCLDRREEGCGPSAKDRSNSCRMSSYRAPPVFDRGSPSRSQSEDILERRGMAAPDAAGGRVAAPVPRPTDLIALGVVSGGAAGLMMVSGAPPLGTYRDDSAHADSHNGVQSVLGLWHHEVNHVKKPAAVRRAKFQQLVDVLREVAVGRSFVSSFPLMWCSNVTFSQKSRGGWR